MAINAAFFDGTKYKMYMWRRKEIKALEKSAAEHLVLADRKKRELLQLAKQNGDTLDVERFVESGNFGESLEEHGNNE